MNFAGRKHTIIDVRNYYLSAEVLEEKFKLIEEIVSGTAIVRNYGEDAKSLATKAFAGDEKAIAIFRELGEVLGQALCQVKEIEDTQCLVIGGQISNAFALFEKGIVRGLGQYAEKINVIKAVHPANAALIGASAMLMKCERK